MYPTSPEIKTRGDGVHTRTVIRDFRGSISHSIFPFQGQGLQKEGKKEEGREKKKNIGGGWQWDVTNREGVKHNQICIVRACQKHSSNRLHACCNSSSLIFFFLCPFSFSKRYNVRCNSLILRYTHRAVDVCVHVQVLCAFMLLTLDVGGKSNFTTAATIQISPCDMYTKCMSVCLLYGDI